jgi:hypothetical protein
MFRAPVCLWGKETYKFWWFVAYQFACVDIADEMGDGGEDVQLPN